jgi:ribosomal protein L7/L12
MDIKTDGILSIIEAMRGKNGRRTIASVYREIERELDYLISKEVQKAIVNERARVETEKNQISFTNYNSPAIIEALKFTNHGGNRNKIQAIKLLREGTSCGLREAKDEIERRLEHEPEKWGYPPESARPPQY